MEAKRAEFNLNRSNRLETIQRLGREGSAEIAACTKEAEALRSTAETEVEAEKAALEAVRALQLRRIPAVPYEDTEEGKALHRQLAVIEKQMGDPDAATRTALSGIDEQLQAANEALRLEQARQSAFAVKDAQEHRIAELEGQEKALSARYEELERGIFLCEQFTKAKVRMLTDRINGKFRSVRFRLFIEQVNGGIKDDCEVLVPSEAGAMVPYRDANNAARINAGLEIIGALSAHWNTSMPVFIDNAESVTRLCGTLTQTIRLVVSEPDKVLRLELDKPGD